MKKAPVKLLDVVALWGERPHDGLAVGQVGTVVELHSSDAFEVEFLDLQGHTIALVPLRASEVLVLRHEPIAAAS